MLRRLFKSKKTIETNIPGRPPVQLTAYYPEFLGYYPDCEMQTKQWFVQHMERDWHIIDCGANIGYYSILFSQLAPEGHVYAIEPTSTAEMLKENIRFNKCKNISIHQFAAGDKCGTHEDAIYRVWGNEPETQPYEFKTLDGFVADEGLTRLDCIKIDVDSFDFEVLRGARETLRKFNPYVVVELNHALDKRCQSNAQALAWIADEGYTSALSLDHENFVFRKGYVPSEPRSLSIHFSPEGPSR